MDSANINKMKNKKDKQEKIQDIPETRSDALTNEEKTFINNILTKQVEKYKEIAEEELKDQRMDYICLQKVTSEFLTDYIIIGHNFEGQRVLIKTADTPAKIDSLNELCKKLLIHLMMQEQNTQF
jgi:hypothetical protein